MGNDPANKVAAVRPWAAKVYATRKLLGETQTQFGKRFNVSHAAVSDWEHGESDVPGDVTWWLLGYDKQSDDYQRAFSDGFKKALWFARKIEELSPSDLFWFENQLKGMGEK